MNIVVVGGRGFIGRPLVEKLKQNHEVETWDLPDVDIRFPDSFSERLKNIRPDAVIHLAGLLGNVSSDNVREIFETNFGGTLNVLEACRRAGVKKFVFASSLTVHGSNDPKSPNTLNSPFRPIHAYGASKAAGEFALQEYARRFGMSAVALRPTIVLGDTPTPNAAVEFIRSLLRGEDIVIYGTGEHEREWIWIDDVAEGFCRALEFCMNAAPGYYPFFLSGNRIAMRDLAQMCTRRLGGKIKFVESTAKTFTLTCDIQESNARLGWSPTIDLDAIIERLIVIERSKFVQAPRTL